MFRSRKLGSIVVVLALTGLAFATTGGAVAGAAKQKPDKTAVLRVGGVVASRIPLDLTEAEAVRALIAFCRAGTR